MVRSAPGRFEVAAMDASAAHGVVALAEETWRNAGGVLGLPEAFSSPVFVRLVDITTESTVAVPREAKAGFDAVVEPGGVVSVRIHWPRTGAGPSLREQRRALVHGLLLRHAVAMHGGQGRSVVPRWLETAVVGWCETRHHPAQLDAFKHEAQTIAPPALAAIFADTGGIEPEGTRAAAESGARMIAATWLLSFLHGETTRAGEWSAFLRAVLGGAAAEEALAAAYPGRFASEAERELWWQTGWHHWRRVRTLPALDPAESRVALAALARFVFAPGEHDMVLPLRSVLAHGNDAVLQAELRRRGTELGRLVPALHAFYRNAGLSLAAAFQTTSVTPAKREAACAQFDEDWRDAIELEAATKAALDALEAQRR